MNDFMMKVVTLEQRNGAVVSAWSRFGLRNNRLEATFFDAQRNNVLDKPTCRAVRYRESVHGMSTMDGRALSFGRRAAWVRTQQLNAEVGVHA